MKKYLITIILFFDFGFSQKINSDKIYLVKSEVIDGEIIAKYIGYWEQAGHFANSNIIEIKLNDGSIKKYDVSRVDKVTFYYNNYDDNYKESIYKGEAIYFLGVLLSFTMYYKNGQKEFEEFIVDSFSKSKKYNRKMWYYNGQIKFDGYIIDEWSAVVGKCWDKSGKEIDCENLALYPDY